MEIQRVKDVDAFRRLRTEWNDLLAASHADCVFLTWDWLFTWWKHFGAGFRLAILAVRDRGELVGIAPLALRRRLGFPVLEFLGSGLVGSDYIDVIVRPDRRTAALRALAHHLDDSGIWLDLARVRRGAADAIGMMDELGRHRWRRTEIPHGVCPFIPLGGETWSSYLAKLGPKHRANLRRRLRQVTRRFAVTFERAESSEERCAAFATLLRLHLDRWRGSGGSDGLGSPSLVAFHEEMTEVARQRGWLRLFVLSFDGVPVASLYGLRYGRVFSFYQSGFDQAFAKYSVGLIAMGLAIKSAIGEGVEEYDLLHGDERYKFLWARDTRELTRFELYPCRLRHLFLARARVAKRSAKRTVRSLVNRAIPGRPTATAVEEALGW